MAIKIYHNPRCSKSRQTLALLEEQKIDPEVILYLETPPSAAAIKDLVTALSISPRALMRKGETIYKELNLAAEEAPQALIEAMSAHPILIERPIVINDKRKAPNARIGRPPEAVLEIL